MITFIYWTIGVYMGGFLVRLAYLTEDHDDMPIHIHQMRQQQPVMFLIAAICASLMWPKVFFPPKKKP